MDRFRWAERHDGLITNETARAAGQTKRQLEREREAGTAAQASAEACRLSTVRRQPGGKRFARCCWPCRDRVPGRIGRRCTLLGGGAELRDRPHPRDHRSRAPGHARRSRLPSLWPARGGRPRASRRHALHVAPANRDRPQRRDDVRGTWQGGRRVPPSKAVEPRRTARASRPHAAGAGSVGRDLAQGAGQAPARIRPG